MLMSSPRFPAFPLKGRIKSAEAVAFFRLGRLRQSKAPDKPELPGRNAGFLPRSRGRDCSDPIRTLLGVPGQNCDFYTAKCTYPEGTNQGPGVVAHYKTHRRDTHERTPKGPTAWQFIPAGLSGRRSSAKREGE